MGKGKGKPPPRQRERGWGDGNGGGVTAFRGGTERNEEPQNIAVRLLAGGGIKGGEYKIRGGLVQSPYTKL